MPEISENTLMMSIQAVHRIAEQNSAERDTATGSEQANYDEIIETYEIVAMELRNAYEKACSQGANLPPYNSLLHQPTPRDPCVGRQLE